MQTGFAVVFALAALVYAGGLLALGAAPPRVGAER
jgi:hypothetical protein